MRATGTGSMPGTDLRETLRVVLGELPDLPFLPELPGRGVHAAMTGRTGALLPGLSLDLQPAGWRLASGTGIDQRRAASLLREDLDALEELAGGHERGLKVQVAGPWTLAATIERPRGDKVLGDHGARRELAESLAEGVRAHVADVRRRVPGADLVVQVDEPALPAVLAAQVPTASGFSRHRAVHPPEADAALRLLCAAVAAAGARPVVHCCAADVPVELLAGSGFAAVSFDAALVAPDDRWSEAFESGVDLWPGVTPASGVADETSARRALEAVFARLDQPVETYGPRTVVMPACGLAAATPSAAGATLRTLARIAADAPQTT